MKPYRFFYLSLAVICTVSACQLFNLTGISLSGQPTKSVVSGPCLTLGPDEPVVISGDIPYTSPFFLNSISQPFVMLEDQAGFMRRDREFRFPLEGQVIGPVNVDKNQKLTYTLSLPSVPQGTLLDVDNNGTKDIGVQVFQIAYWSNTWGDTFLEERDGKGWSNAYNSAVTDPENDDEIIGGTLIVWSPDENQKFPSGFGADKKLFTVDDPVQPIRAGYNLVDLSSEPFRFYKERNPTLTLTEGAGAVKDFSHLSYQRAFEALHEKVSREYPFTAEKGIDWEGLKETFIPRFKKANSDKDFYRALRDYSFQIPDGHVGLSINRDVFFDEYGGGFGMILDRLSDGRVVVKDVLADLPAEKAGILQGAEILSWDGEPVDQAISKVVPGFGPYSTQHTMKQAQVSFLSRRSPNTQVDVVYMNPGNSQQKSATLKAVSEYDSLFMSIPSFNVDSLELPLVGQELNEGGIGYIRIDTFSDDYALMAGVWDRYIQNLIENEVPGLIIDLRANSGGSMGLAMDFAGYFFDQEINLYENYYFSDKTGKFEPTGYPTRIRPAPLHYKGPIAILVSSDCVSACEGFAFALQHDGRSTVIGHYPTAGAFGEVGLGQYKMPGDYTMQFPTGRSETSDGKLVIEGSGVQPDITVPVTLESALGQSDAVLERAIQELVAQIR